MKCEICDKSAMPLDPFSSDSRLKDHKVHENCMGFATDLLTQIQNESKESLRGRLKETSPYIKAAIGATVSLCSGLIALNLMPGTEIMTTAITGVCTAVFLNVYNTSKEANDVLTQIQNESKESLRGRLKETSPCIRAATATAVSLCSGLIALKLMPGTEIMTTAITGVCTAVFLKVNSRYAN